MTYCENKMRSYQGTLETDKHPSKTPDKISKSQKCKLNLKIPNLKCHFTSPAGEEAKCESQI